MQLELNTEPNVYAKNFPRFDHPKIIGFIDIHNLKFARHFKSKEVMYDLNLHIDKAKRRPEDLDVKLTELLKFLLDNHMHLNLPYENNLDNANFFCYRGLMTCIACTPYEKREPWKIVAILFKGNIYLCARDTEQKILRKKNMTEREKRCSSWGYKFEQFVLSDSPFVDPDPNVPVDETEEFSLVMKTKLNKHCIIYGAEMDGIRCGHTEISMPPTGQNTEAVVQYLSTQEFIELKTNRHIENERQERNFRLFKAKKWWLQSFLVGIQQILCGIRNDDGIVEELKIYSVRELQKKSEKYWKANVCFNFLDTFLTYIKSCLAQKITQKYGEKAYQNLQKLPLTTILFEWSPNMPVTINENYNHEDDPILHHWFIKNYGRQAT